MRIVALTQARLGSTRLPQKVLKKIGGSTLLGIHLMRLKKSKLIDEVVVATTTEVGSDLICDIAEKNGAKWSKGSVNDVLDRFYQAAIFEKADWVVRVTSDCPLIDPIVIDEVISEGINGDYDYFTNTLVEDYPDGQDVEIFKFSALERAWKEATKPSEREHVTPYIRKNCSFNGGNLFKGGDYPSPKNFNMVRMTVDEQVDFEMIEWLIHDLGVHKGWLDYTTHMLDNPDKLVNAEILRNAGYLKSLKQDQ